MYVLILNWMFILYRGQIPDRHNLRKDVYEFTIPVHVREKGMPESIAVKLCDVVEAIAS